ncbi:MAG: DoxX family protein [Bdellovibrionota bacterium]
MKKLLFSGQNIEGMLPNFLFFVVRVQIGLMMAFGHGLGKIPPQEQFIGFLSKMGLPFPDFLAWCAGLSEFLCALFVALGLMTRLSASFLLITMFVAAFIAHGADPFAKKEMALLYFSGFLAFLALGAGSFSLDAIVRKIS